MNTTQKSLLLGLAFASACALPATVHFQNAGTHAGWASNNSIGGSPASITQVTGYTWPNHTSGTSLRFFVEYPAYRAEKQKSASLGQRGQTRYYGFALWIDSAWQNMPDRDAYFCQNIADYNANCPGSSSVFAPSFFFGSRGGDFKSIYYTGNPCGNRTGNVRVLRSLIKGQWVKVVYRATWRSDSTGRLEVWINGVKYQDYTGANTFPFTRNMNFKSGMYIPGWQTSKGTSSQSLKKVWIDQWRVGDSYAEVDPSNW